MHAHGNGVVHTPNPIYLHACLFTSCNPLRLLRIALSAFPPPRLFRPLLAPQPRQVDPNDLNWGLSHCWCTDFCIAKYPSFPFPPRRRVKMTRLRMRVAERLKGAQNTYAMLSTFNEVDMSQLIELRNAYKVSCWALTQAVRLIGGGGLFACTIELRNAYTVSC